ncbi:unnamed protein product [Penicillium pancosmium]
MAELPEFRFKSVCLEFFSQEFLSSTLSLYDGPKVKFKIASHYREHVIFKELLCSKSAYFATMFNGPFRNGQEQTAILEEGDGLSVPTFEAFIQ